MSKKYKIGWIVLHYEALKETYACVETVLHISTENDHIIIVDNHSPNGSGQELLTRFQDITNVDIILNEENAGFARGNNVGYAIAKHKYRCDFIVLLNNDTLIRQEDFRNKLLAAYKIHHFAVMGPKILCGDGTCNPCSPAIPIHTTLTRARLGQASNYIRYILSICNLDLWIGRILDKRLQTNLCQTDQYRENVQIAGCCMIFSKEYIDRFEGLNPGTFMYLEEIILYIRVAKAGLKIAYNPELEIIHLEDAATLKSFQGKTGKVRRFKYKCQMNSFKVLIYELTDR